MEQRLRVFRCNIRRSCRNCDVAGLPNVECLTPMIYALRRSSRRDLPRGLNSVSELPLMENGAKTVDVEAACCTSHIRLVFPRFASEDIVLARPAGVLPTSAMPSQERFISGGFQASARLFCSLASEVSA